MRRFWSRSPAIAIRSSSPARSELEEVKASLPELTGELKSVAGNLNALLSAQNRQAVTDSLQNIRTVTAALAGHSQDLGAILDNANAAVVALRSLLHNVDQSYSPARRIEGPGLADAQGL